MLNINFFILLILCISLSKNSFASGVFEAERINLVFPNKSISKVPKKTIYKKSGKDSKLLVHKKSSIFTKTISYKHKYIFNADVIYPSSGKVLKNFGWQFFGEGTFENGIYIKPSTNVVYAPSSGEIVFNGYVEEIGNTIAIKSENFFTLVSGNLNFKLKKGENVRRGQEISDNANHSELYFEVRDLNGNPFDPIAVVRKERRVVKNKNIFQSFEQLLLKHGFEKKVIPTMYCIANWESGFNPSVTNYNRNKTLDLGLFQINSIWKSKCKISSLNQLYDINLNTRCALTVLKTQGLTAWVTYNKFKNFC